MVWKAITLTLISSILSGVLGIFISNWYSKKRQKKQLKLDLLKNILGYSYQLTGNVGFPPREIVVYLNQIYVLFNSSNEVIDALLKYKNDTRADSLISLIKKMCDDVKVSYNHINDSFIEAPFTPNN